MRGGRLKVLVPALIAIAISVGLYLFLSYADAHKYDSGFDWVSSAVMQPLALVMVAAFVTGLVLMIAALLQKPAK